MHALHRAFAFGLRLRLMQEAALVSGMMALVLMQPSLLLPLTTVCGGLCLAIVLFRPRLCGMQMSQVACNTLHVTRYTSHVTRHTSQVTRYTLHVTRYTSHVTRHTSNVTRHLRLWLSPLRLKSHRKHQGFRVLFLGVCTPESRECRRGKFLSRRRRQG